MIRDYISIDLETTGLNPREDVILEIGGVKVRDGNITETFHTMVNPHRRIPEHVTNLTGIKQSDVENQPDFSDIMGTLLEFLGDDVLLGHSILFDYSFLKRAIVNHGGVTNKGQDTFEKQGIDTLKIARKLLPNVESRSLVNLCKYYGIPLQAHRAYEDAAATSALYQRMATEVTNQQDLMPYRLIYRVKKEGPITPTQKERLYYVLNKHKIEAAYEIETLTKNQASRYLDKILAEYGR